MPTAAVILCGGRSRRMGRPKAWLPFGPECLLQRVVRLVGASARPIVVVAAPDQELPPLPSDVGVVRDAVSDRGPLQGLAAGLAALPVGATFAFATSTDAPFLRPAWIDRLVELADGANLVLPHVGGFDQPLAALYRVEAVRPAIDRLLAADRLRPVFLRDEVTTRVVGAAELATVDPGLATLRNLNTPEEYAAALAELGFEPVAEDAPEIRCELFGVPRLRAGTDLVVLRARRLGGAIDGLVRAHPALAALLDPDGSLHRAYRVSLNGDRFVRDRDTPLAEGDTLLVLAADVGG